MRDRGRRGGFTLAEIACVVGIAGIILGLAAVGGLHARMTSAVRAASAGVATLDMAIRSFENKRGALPADTNEDGLTTAQEIISQLKSWDILNQKFSPLDPWGHPYVIVLKRDYSLSADTMYDSNYFPLNDVPNGFQVYSLGPDGVTGMCQGYQETVDDIANFPT